MPPSTMLTVFLLFGFNCLAAPTTTEPGSISTVSLIKTTNFLDVVSLKSSSNKKTSSSVINTAANYGVAKLRNLLQDSDWAVKVTIDGQPTYLALDTGSSDTWVVQSGFQCIDQNGVNQTADACKFGPGYQGTFKEGKIDNMNMLAGYGEGEFISGDLGFSNITIGSIHVPKQEVALVNQAYWEGDGITSGLLGLAYSTITSAYIGTNTTIDNATEIGTAPGDRTPYSPIFQTMISEGLHPPIFSLALQRASSPGNNVPGGYIAFGGLPPVTVNTSAFVTTPIIAYKLPGYPEYFATNRSYYTIKPCDYMYENKKGVRTAHATSMPAIVDSGTTLLYVPTAVAHGYLASFSPPPSLYQGGYYYPCDAEAPPFAIKIAGKTFNISSADVLSRETTHIDPTTGVQYCLIGVVDKGPLPFALFGGVFLKNVVAVFNMVANTLQIAPHVY